MSSAASNYLETALLNHFRGAALPLPAGYWVALHTADPTDNGTSEVTLAAWPAYARQPAHYYFSVPAPESAPPQGEVAGHESVIEIQLDWAALNGPDSITVTHFSIWDAANGGNMWAHAPFNTAKTLDQTDLFSTLPGSLKFIFR